MTYITTNGFDQRGRTLRRLRSVTVWGAALLLLGGAAPPSDEPYTPLFDKVWTTVDDNFYDPTFRGVDWRAVGERYRGEVKGVRDDTAFRSLIGRMLSELKVSHLGLSAPSATNDQRRGIGAQIETVDGLPTFVSVSTLSDAWRKGLRPGDQLIGPTSAVYGAMGTVAMLSIRDCADTQRTLEVERVTVGWPAEQPGWRWSRISPRVDRSVGYLKIDRFDDGADALADQAMAALGDTQGLVIDLRGNSGGNVSGLRLASYFVAQGDVPAIALFARPYLQRLGRAPTAADIAKGPRVAGIYTDEGVFRSVSEHGGAAVFHTESLPDKRYRGAVVILIGGDTASAAEGFAWALRGTDNVRFVGRKSAAALLSGERFPLGDGWTLTVPVHGLWDGAGNDLADRPVEPDFQTSWTREDLCRGRDPDLEAAFDMLAEFPD